jgi:hypothetical protein
MPRMVSRRSDRYGAGGVQLRHKDDLCFVDVDFIDIGALDIGAVDIVVLDLGSDEQRHGASAWWTRHLYPADTLGYPGSLVDAHAVRGRALHPRCRRRYGPLGLR